LPGNQRGGGFDRFDAFAFQPPDVGLSAIKDNQTEKALIEQHVFERFGQKVRITVIAERLDRLGGRLQDARDHIGLAAAAIDRAGEDDNPVFGWERVVVPEAVFNRRESVLNVGPSLFGFNVGSLGVFLNHVFDDRGYLFVVGNVDCDELSPRALVCLELFDDLAELIFPAVLAGLLVGVRTH